MKKLNKSDIKTLALSALGGTLEFYDFIIFLIFASYFQAHFFPADMSDGLKQFNIYATYAAGYLARPLGGIVMAHFGDKFGRKNMFMLSIILMVVPTFIFSIMPTYESIGYFAVGILIIIRLLQGIAIGGELPGAWVYVREHAPEHAKGIFLGLLTCGVAGGILLGNAVALILQLNFTEAQLHDWMWRVPFFIGGVFGILSIYLRRFLQETPTFKKMQQSNELRRFPLKDVLKHHKSGLLLSGAITWVLTACIMVMLLIVPNFTRSILSLPAHINTVLNMAGVFMLLVGLVSAGALADNLRASSVCKFFAVGLFAFSALFFHELLGGKNVILCCIYYLLCCLFTGIVNFTPIFMNDVFSPSVRFSGLSFGYNIAYAIAGAITPNLIIILMNAKTPGSLAAQYGPALYMCAIAVVGFLCAIWFDKINLNKN